ncbi:MAG: hypothetical protein M1820_007819 [Bogoriella megaspora]|nr:MAG: hypothetical protein M1820_007819 [Bogoriella megaspora]
MGDSVAFKEINVSRPQLTHAGTQISETASEHYYSLSDDDSSGANEYQFETPPSRFRSPEPGNGRNASRSLLSLVKSAQRRHPAPVGHARLDNIGIKRKPVPAQRAPSQQQPSLGDLRPPKPAMEEMAPTPGIDDTPYIHFAIEQLTRDEEVRGSRSYQTPRPFPITQQEGPSEQPSRSMQPAQRPEQSPPTPPRHPQHTYQRFDPLATHPDKFVFYKPPKYSVQHPGLNFRPAILRPILLGTFLFLCTLMLTGLLFSSIWSLTHDGLWNYGHFGDGRYFVFEYLPTLLGIILFMWLIQIEIAVYRISPFIAMASDSSHLRSYGPLLDLYPSSFLFPDLQHFRAGLPVIGAFVFISWLQIFTIPLLAAAFDVRYDGNPANGNWRWMAVQGVIWVIIVLFVFLIASLVVLLVYFQRATTGLRWDPRSIADIVVLLERANVLSAYQNSEAFSRPHDFHRKLKDRADRLGYWHTYKHPAFIFYGLGQEGAPTRRYTIEGGQIREKEPERASYANPDDDLEAQSRPMSQQPLRRSLSQSFREGPLNLSASRYRYLPWFLNFSSSLLWALAATVLVLAFLVISFVNRAVLSGFDPDVPVGANSDGFSAPNFLFSFIPAILGMLCFLFWLPIDLAFRRLQPYAELSRVNGSPADKSLLLDYPAGLPVLVSLHAATNRHWKVTILSFVSILAALFPILAGGVFWAQFFVKTQSIRITAQPSAYYALCVFLVLYAAAYWLAFTGRSRALPHESKTLAEVISWVYMSRIVTDETFAGCRTKAELVTRLLSIPVGERSAAPPLGPAGSAPTAEGSSTQPPRVKIAPPPSESAALSDAPPDLQFDTTGYEADTGYEAESTSRGLRSSQQLRGSSENHERSQQEGVHLAPPNPAAGMGPSTSTFESDSTGPPSRRPTNLGSILSSFNASVMSLASKVGRVRARHPSLLVEQQRQDAEKGSEGRSNVGRVPRYGFGIYKGRDGREHLGIERVDRPGGLRVGVFSG